MPLAMAFTSSRNCAAVTPTHASPRCREKTTLEGFVSALCTMWSVRLPAVGAGTMAGTLNSLSTCRLPRSGRRGGENDVIYVTR